MRTLGQWVTYWREYWQQYYLQWQARRMAAQKKQRARQFHRKVAHPLKVEVVKPLLWRVPVHSLKNRDRLLAEMVHAMAKDHKKPKV